MSKSINANAIGKSFSLGKRVITLNDKTSQEDIELIYKQFPNLFTLNNVENVKTTKTSLVKNIEDGTLAQS